MHRAGVVDDLESHEVASGDHVHRRLREQLPVDRPVVAGSTVHESDLLADLQDEAAVEVRGGAEERRFRTAVAGGIEVASSRLSLNLAVAAEYERCRASVDAEPNRRSLVLRYDKGDVVPRPSAEEQRLVLHRRRAVEVRAVDRGNAEWHPTE